MARSNAVNFSGALQFPMASAATDLFKKEDVQTLALAVDGHDHSSGKGLALSGAAIPSGTITSAMIADGTIATTDLAAGACTGAALGTEFGAWQTWSTMAISQGGTVTFTTTFARYQKVGKFAHVSVSVNITGSGSAGTYIQVGTIPIAPLNTGYYPAGTFLLLKSAVGYRSGIVQFLSASNIAFLIENNPNYVGATPNLALANGDSLGFNLVYEAA
jgi:hypothetical protein